MKNKEVRMLSAEFRALDNKEEKMIIEGYPITFESPATHWGMTEIIDKNALDKTDMSDVPLKYNHEDSHLIMARTRNKSLKLEVDDKGLKMTAELIDTQSNRDIYKSIKAGLIDKMSFAFTTRGEEWNDETNTRRVTDIDKLWDVSVVDIPFYDTSSVMARSLDTSKEYADKKQKEKRKRLVEKLARRELLDRL